MPPENEATGVAEATIPANETSDIRASLEAEFSKAENTDAVTTATPHVDTGTATEKVEAKETPEQTAERERDDKGRFKPKAEASADKAAPAETKLPAQDDKAKVTAGQQSKAAPDGPPVSWAADAKQTWDTLPPVIKTAVLKRESEVSQGFKQKSDELRHYETVLDPVRQEAARLGVDVATGLNALMTAHYKLNQNPRQAILELAQQYGVDLGNITGHQTSADSSSPDPLAPVRSELDAIRQHLAAEQRHKGLSVQSTVQQFASSEGHEHFDAVSNEIMAMIPQIKAQNPMWSHEKTLQEAYDRAVFANPETRSQILEQRERDAEGKRVADAKDRTAKAKLAGSSVTGSSNGAAPQAQTKGSVREELEAAFADAR